MRHFCMSTIKTECDSSQGGRWNYTHCDYCTLSHSAQNHIKNNSLPQFHKMAVKLQLLKKTQFATEIRTACVDTPLKCHLTLPIAVIAVIEQPTGLSLVISGPHTAKTYCQLAHYQVLSCTISCSLKLFLTPIVIMKLFITPTERMNATVGHRWKWQGDPF